MTSEQRYRELDALRGIAVLMMVVYHAAFNLAYFYGWEIAVLEGGWWLLARATATLFLLTMGVCFVISWHRRCLDTPRHVIPSDFAERSGAKLYRGTTRRGTRHDMFWLLYKNYLKRGITIFTGGMLLSLVTWFIAPEAFIKFGILHLIGVSALLQPFFQRCARGNFLLGAAFIAIGMDFKEQMVMSPFLFPLGLTYHGFASLDYYPLFPWFGVILIGMALGRVLYVPEPVPALRALHRKQLLAPRSSALLSSVEWTGRRALILYFLHQPVLLLLLALMQVLGIRF